MDAVIQFNHWRGAGRNATIKDGKVDVAWHAPSPKMTLPLTSADYVKIFTGELDGMKAFMEG
jgi:putative sterol carrier protein